MCVSNFGQNRVVAGRFRLYYAWITNHRLLNSEQIRARSGITSSSDKQIRLERCVLGLQGH